jgi:hypothetical protein
MSKLNFEPVAWRISGKHWSVKMEPGEKWGSVVSLGSVDARLYDCGDGSRADALRCVREFIEQLRAVCDEALAENWGKE